MISRVDVAVVRGSVQYGRDSRPMESVALPASSLVLRVPARQSRGSFTSVKELAWTKDPDEILGKI